MHDNGALLASIGCKQEKVASTGGATSCSIRGIAHRYASSPLSQVSPPPCSTSVTLHYSTLTIVTSITTTMQHQCHPSLQHTITIVTSITTTTQHQCHPSLQHTITIVTSITTTTQHQCHPSLQHTITIVTSITTTTQHQCHPSLQHTITIVTSITTTTQHQCHPSLQHIIDHFYHISHLPLSWLPTNSRMLSMVFKALYVSICMCSDICSTYVDILAWMVTWFVFHVKDVSCQQYQVNEFWLCCVCSDYWLYWCCGFSQHMCCVWLNRWMLCGWTDGCCVVEQMDVVWLRDVVLSCVHCVIHLTLW